MLVLVVIILFHIFEVREKASGSFKTRLALDGPQCARFYFLAQVVACRESYACDWAEPCGVTRYLSAQFVASNLSESSV